MFGGLGKKLGGFVAKAEKVTGKDLDGDGKAGTAGNASKAANALGGSSGGGSANPIHAAESALGRDLDGDGKIGAGKAAPAGARATEELDDGVDLPVSTCTGNKKSLFIGINYKGQQGELRGCINDVKNIKAFVVEKYGFKEDDEHMRTLTDETKDKPTKANMIEAMKWLVKGAKKNDSLFFHYSGHGGTQKDTAPDTDEADGQDETLIPLDYKTNGVIVDDDLHEILVKSLPEGVRLTAIVDACHSGSLFDLPYTYTINGALEVQETDNRKEAIAAAIAAGKAYFISKDPKAAMAHGMDALKKMMKGPGANDSEAQSRAVAVRSSLADVIQLSGCRDEQTSADAHIGGEATGACSWAFIKAFTDKPNMTYTEMLGAIRTLLMGKYSQVPQLSAGHKLRLDKAPFMM